MNLGQQTTVLYLLRRVMNSLGLLPDYRAVTHNKKWEGSSLWLKDAMSLCEFN